MRCRAALGLKAHAALRLNSVITCTVLPAPAHCVAVLKRGTDLARIKHVCALQAPATTVRKLRVHAAPQNKRPPSV